MTPKAATTTASRAEGAANGESPHAATPSWLIDMVLAEWLDELPAENRRPDAAEGIEPPVDEPAEEISRHPGREHRRKDERS